MIGLVPVNRACRTKPADVGSVDGFPFQVQQPDVVDYLLAYDWPYGGRIAQLRITSTIGTGLVSVLINGQVVTGIDNVPVAANTRSQFNAEGNNLFAPGDDIVLRVNANVNLLNLRGTLVVSNKTVFQSSQSPLDVGGFESGEIPLIGGLAGTDQIPFAVVPQLRRNPTHIFKPFIVKNAPTEDSVTVLAIQPFAPNDYTNGWTYFLSANAVAGQVLKYAYIL